MLKHLFIFTSLLLSLTSLGTAKPNIVLIMCDDLGYGDIYNLFQHTRDNGAGGGTAGDGIINGSEKPFIYTPNLDRMAAEGAKLTRHYTCAPVCAPARGSLIQGRDQGHSNVRNNAFDKPVADNHTIGTVMQKAGYYTAVVGKWGIGGKNSDPDPAGAPNKRGFDYFYGYLQHDDGHHHYPATSDSIIHENATVVSDTDPDLHLAYTTDLFAAKAKSIIIDRTQNHPNTPFFVYLAFDTPHTPKEVPAYAYPAGAGLNGGLTWPLTIPAGAAEDSYFHPDYASMTDETNKRHATMVRRIDTAVGDILQTLRDLNIDDNTLVIFTSDNGPHAASLQAYGEFEGIKRDMWEGGVREPTFAWWPTKIGDNNQATPALNSIRPSSFSDWMPTLVDAANVTPPAWTSGVSLLPELTGTGAQQDKGYLYFEYKVGTSTPNYFTNHGGAKRGEMQIIYLDDTDDNGNIVRYKGIRTNIQSHADDFKIYNVDIDLKEANDLAPSKPALQQRMKDKVLQVRIDGDYTRPYSSELIPAVSTPTIHGLDYKAFTGAWAWVPETNYLTPVASGNANNFDLSKRTQDNNIALEFKGYIKVATDGVYTFQMTTDSSVATNTSGGMLWIHDANILDDDFHHDGTSKSATEKLAAGLHPIRVIYKHATGNHDLKLQYSGPGIALQDVPDAVLYRDGTPPPEPVANPDHASTSGTTQVSIPVLANDSDDGAPSPLSIQAVSNPSFGTAIISGTDILYTADAGKYGTDQFTYTITDGQFTATATVTVNITVPSSDLWVPLNETSGNTVAEAGGRIVGTLSGFADSESAHIPGKHGYALTFDGVDDQVELSEVTPPTGNAPRTIAAWIRVSATSDVENQIILGYGTNSNGKRFSFRLEGSTTQKLRLEVGGGNIVGSTVINDGQWHHVACVVDDFDGDGTTNVNETKLYVDGVLEPVSGSSSEAIDTDASNIPVIGGSAHSTSYNFKGDIDEVYIYSSAKSAADIENLASATDQTSASWLYRHFGDSPPAWTDDSDGDGYNLLAEYSFGGNPHISDGNALTPSAMYNQDSNKLEVTFNRRKTGTHTLSYTVQVSSDLKTWDLPSTEISVIPHPTLGEEFERVTVESEALDSNTPHQFIRIRADW